MSCERTRQQFDITGIILKRRVIKRNTEFIEDGKFHSLKMSRFFA
jgi:hypothetical protein